MNNPSSQINPPTLSPYALSLEMGAIKAELSGFYGLAGAFRALLEKEARSAALLSSTGEVTK